LKTFGEGKVKMSKHDAFVQKLWPTPLDKKEVVENFLKQDRNALLNGETLQDSITVTISPEVYKPIQDDVYWLEANLRMKRGEFDQSLALLQKILTDYPDDILADDASFMQGDLYENYLKDKARAMDVYRNFLDKYPGSVYAAEARKRFRTLRGDFSATPPNN
jgi:TolA-binding protein